MVINCGCWLASQARQVQQGCTHLFLSFFFFLSPHLRTFSSLLLEREEEKHRCEREALTGCPP